MRHYSKAQGLWHDPELRPDSFTSHLSLDLSTVKASLAGPKRPQDRVNLDEMGLKSIKYYATKCQKVTLIKTPVADADYAMHHGDVVIAVITSQTIRLTQM